MSDIGESQHRMASPRGSARANTWIYLAIALWATAVSAGSIELWRYQLTPGATPAPAPQALPT